MKMKKILSDFGVIFWRGGPGDVIFMKMTSSPIKKMIPKSVRLHFWDVNTNLESFLLTNPHTPIKNYNFPYNLLKLMIPRGGTSPLLRRGDEFSVLE